MPARKTKFSTTTRSRPASRPAPAKRAAAGPSRWKKLGGRVLASTRVFELRAIRYRHPVRKTTRDFYVLDAPGWVNIIALTPENRLVLVRQFRFGINDFSLEIPGGVMERGESPVAAALRELREETGFTGAKARLIGSARPNPAIMSNRCHFVLVEQCKKKSGTDWDPDEEIEQFVLPVEKVYKLAHAGKINHALVLDALFHFLPHWEKIKKAEGLKNHEK